MLGAGQFTIIELFLPVTGMRRDVIFALDRNEP